MSNLKTTPKRNLMFVINYSQITLGNDFQRNNTCDPSGWAGGGSERSRKCQNGVGEAWRGVAWRLVGGRLRNVRVCRKPATSSPDYAADARLLSTLARLLTFQLHFYWTTYPYSSSRWSFYFTMSRNNNVRYYPSHYAACAERFH